MTLIACLFWGSSAQAKNELACGEAQADAVVEIEPNKTSCLNFKSKDDVLALRAQYVNAHPQLLNKPYQPRAEIFARIVNGKPWWGLDGEGVWGKGQRSIEGDSEESRFILNPFLLIAANPYTAKLWDPAKTTAADLGDANFPLTWLPNKITYFPKQSLARVEYDVSGFQLKVERFKEKMVRPKIRNFFGLVAYNARDFGYDYLFVSPEHCKNIENTAPKRKAAKIRQYIHCGDTCGYPGDCNNMSPKNNAIDRIMYKELPARAQILLWKKKPKNVDEPADMTFEIDLR